MNAHGLLHDSILNQFIVNSLVITLGEVSWEGGWAAYDRYLVCYIGLEPDKSPVIPLEAYLYCDSSQERQSFPFAKTNSLHKNLVSGVDLTIISLVANSIHHLLSRRPLTVCILKQTIYSCLTSSANYINKSFTV